MLNWNRVSDGKMPPDFAPVIVAAKTWDHEANRGYTVICGILIWDSLSGRWRSAFDPSGINVRQDFTHWAVFGDLQPPPAETT